MLSSIQLVKLYRGLVTGNPIILTTSKNAKPVDGRVFLVTYNLWHAIKR